MGPGVTPPRYIVEDQLVFVTCGAVGRSFRFLPVEAVVQFLWFVLAAMVRKFGIAVHDVFFASNHFHIVLTDVDGNLPDFMRDLNSLISRGLNALRGTTGTNIEKGYNIVNVGDDEKAVEHCVYSLVNACAAHLVDRARDWTGVSSLGLEYGQPVVFERPTIGLWRNIATGSSPRRRPGRSKSRAAHTGRTRMPARVEFALVRPPVLPDLDDLQLRALIRERVEQREVALRRERESKGHRVLGMKNVLRQSWSDTPSTTRILFQTTPRASGKSKWARLEALGRRLDFEAAYATARTKLELLFASATHHGTVLAERLVTLAELGSIFFPRGTYLLCRRYGLPCVAVQQ
jgi:putative transposase